MTKNAECSRTALLLQLAEQEEGGRPAVRYTGRPVEGLCCRRQGNGTGGQRGRVNIDRDTGAGPCPVGIHEDYCARN